MVDSWVLMVGLVLCLLFWVWLTYVVLLVCYDVVVVLIGVGFYCWFDCMSLIIWGLACLG